MMRIVPKAKVELVHASKDRLGETLWWLDIENPKLHSLGPSRQDHQSFADDTATYLGSQALTASGDHLLARDLDLYTREADGALSHFATIEEGLDNRLNDGRVDRFGRLWIGTMDNQLHRPNGSVYCVDPDGSIYHQFGDVIVSNGIAFSPDNKRFHFTDTRRYQSYVFDVDAEDGSIHNRRIFADYSETGDRPDGACFDADGGLWTAFFAGGKIVRYAPDGAIDTIVEMPVTNPTCVCFGGADLKTLYVTTAAKFLTEQQLANEPLAGSVFAIHGLAQGLPEHRFAL
jgi:sugar lactone lactonase YvrE